MIILKKIGLTLSEKEMDKNEKSGCSSIIAIGVCLLISGLVFGSLAEYIGFLAYPLIIAGGFGLAKLTEPIWHKDDES